MIKEIRALRLQYQELMRQNVEYISIGQVVNALHHMEGEARMKRVPKNQR